MARRSSVNGCSRPGRSTCEVSTGQRQRRASAKGVAVPSVDGSCQHARVSQANRRSDWCLASSCQPTSESDIAQETRGTCTDMLPPIAVVSSAQNSASIRLLAPSAVSAPHIAEPARRQLPVHHRCFLLAHACYDTLLPAPCPTSASEIPSRSQTDRGVY